MVVKGYENSEASAQRGVVATQDDRVSRTFYGNHSMALREHYLFVCTNHRSDDDARGSCAARGSEEVQQSLKAELAARGLNRFKARVCRSSCLDQCSSGVTILVEPEHFFYGHVTVADVPEIVAAIKSGERVERLVLRNEARDDN